MKQNNASFEKALEDFLKNRKSLILQELLSWLFGHLGKAERSIYLVHHPEDKANGFYERTLQIGSLPFPVEIPRTRYTGFRPSFLPQRRTRYLPEDYLALASSLLLGSRSIQSATRALKNLNLPINQECLQEVIEQFVTYLETLNYSPLPSDLAALVIDAKYIHQKIPERNEVQEYTTYVALGLTLEGQKRILGLYTFEGQESLEGWKKTLEKLLQRGLRRVLIVVHDDFSGLLSLTSTLFPKADVQLCTVHLCRNARKHLSQENYNLFMKYFRSIKTCLTYQQGSGLFDSLLEKLSQSNRFVEQLAKKKEHYLAFLKYPEELRTLFCSTNLAEGINRKIEEAQRACGGYFHSERDRDFRYGVIAKELLEGKWRRPNWKYQRVTHILRYLFAERFENDNLPN